MPTPRTGAVRVTVAVPIVNPIEPVATSVPTCAVALIVVAPAANIVAGLTVTVATPDASVKAVAAGLMVARVPSVLKVMTAFGTTAPAAFFNVAFSVAGEPLEMELTVAPAELVSASVRVGPVVVTVVAVVPVVVPVVPVVVPVVPAVVPLAVPLERPDPLPQPASMVKVAARKSEAERLEISCFRTFHAKKKKFCTYPPFLRNPRK